MLIRASEGTKTAIMVGNPMMQVRAETFTKPSQNFHKTFTKPSQNLHKTFTKPSFASGGALRACKYEGPPCLVAVPAY